MAKSSSHVWVLIWPTGHIWENHAGNPYAFGTKSQAKTALYNSSYKTLRVARFEARKEESK